VASLGYLSGCAPSQLLHTCSLGEYEKVKKVLDFIAATQKHQCYQHSFRTKSKSLQLLRGKLILSQPKPGQLDNLNYDYRDPLMYFD